MTNCPFCGRDPFHRSDSGEAVAVTCCENGDLFFRGARASPEDVTIPWDDFVQIGARLSSMQDALQKIASLEVTRGAAANLAESVLYGAVR